MTGDEADVRATLDGWYSALAGHDLAAAGDALTETFLLIEHDELLDRRELLTALSEDPAHELRASLTDFHVSVAGDIAWSTHRLHEVYTPVGGQPQQLEFLETVVLVRHGGRWLIDRYHATRLSPVS